MIIIIRKIKYKITADDTLDSISRNVAAEVRGRLKNEMADEISRTPNITTVDYRADGEKTYERKAQRTPTGNDPYDLYSRISDDGSISAVRTTPKRDEYVREIYRDGSEKISKEADFVKRINSQNVLDDEKNELARLVRVSSPNATLYKNAENRSKNAFNAFDSNKYFIEQMAGKVGVPASLLGSMYFKQLADSATLAETINPRYARMSYQRLYGVPFAGSDEALKEYLNTPEGVLDFMAIGIKSEAAYMGLDINKLSERQLNSVLSSYARRNNDTSPAYASTVMAYNSVFDDIYKRLPSKEYAVTLR